MSMTFMDFEKPLEVLYEQLEKLKDVGTQGEVDVSDMIRELEKKITAKRKDIYAQLTGWQKVQRTPNEVDMSLFKSQLSYFV